MFREARRPLYYRGMKCPKCRSSLAPVQYEGVEIDRCTKCKGVWVDEGELLTILDREEMPIPESVSKSVIAHAKPGIPKEELQKVENCPKCDGVLRAMNYNYASGIIVDVCPNHHGIWFDTDELEKVQAHYEHWQKRAKEEGQKWAEMAKKGDNSSTPPPPSGGFLSDAFHFLRKTMHL